MKKRFLSRRGFTIVEVMVAFVIFAIMAGMVATILSGTMQAKQENTDLESEIAQQQKEYFTKTQDRTFDSSNSEQLNFQFSGIDPLSIDYSIGDPNADGSDNQIALEYFVGKVDYSLLDGKNNPAPEQSDGGSGSVADQFEKTCITGSNGITSISVILKRDDTYTTGNRYLIAAKAVGEINNQYDQFKQYRLIFPSKIVDYGYCKFQQNDGSFRDIGTASPSGYNITVTNSTTLRVAPTQSTLSDPLINSGYKAMYVELADSLENVSSSLNLYDIFGCCETGQTDKTAQGDGSYLFTRYVESTTDTDGNPIDKTYVNVFAAVEKSKT